VSSVAFEIRIDLAGGVVARVTVSALREFSYGSTSADGFVVAFGLCAFA